MIENNMGFIEDAGIILGYLWGKKRREYPTTDAKHSKIDSKTAQIFEKIEDLYLQVDKESGETYAKIFHDKNTPEWYWLLNHVPKRIVDRIKEQSKITD